MKTCCRCKENKEYIEFSKDKSRKDGYRCLCKKCNREYDKAKRDKINPNRNHIRSKYNGVNGNGIDTIYLSTGEEVKVDESDYALVNQYRWNTNCFGYARVCVEGKTIMMHRLVMNLPKDMHIDHINGVTLDNRKCNLRLCSNTENQQHRTKLASNNTSGVHGVCWHKNLNKWRAQIKVNDKNKHLGFFDDINDAIRVRKEAEEKYFGEFKPLV